MKRLLTAILVGAGLLLSSVASAQELSLRVEPGVAIPATAPQNDRFNPGFALMIKPEWKLGSYFSLGPSGEVVALPAKGSFSDTGTAWALGGFLRLKRPHDANNTGSGWSAVSPWVDADLQYVRTDPLDRLGWAAAVGASVPTDDSRQLWVGPFLRYQGVHQDTNPGFNNNDAKLLIVGLSFEWEPKAAAKTEPKQEPVPCPPVEPPPVHHTEIKEVVVRETVQFALDSAVIDANGKLLLAKVVQELKLANSLNGIRIEGHTSSEGAVEHNNVLAQHRAQAVLEALVSLGIPREKLSAVGYGSSSPVASNATAAGRVANRRAELMVDFVIEVIAEEEAK
jgi:outer membrane protein OmpA-like peptidoglycan-associated protein